MSTEVKLIEHMDIGDLKKEIHELEKVVKNVNRLNFIYQMYRTHNVAESCEITGIPVRTGYDLLKKWNEFGIEG
ncbi:MAG: helix-turn-helix domain containing protein, partial [Methanobrevibacter sp.]|nr:helix-turn-helix domain containing protein [Candidatus Methanoflexus mossambicus]